MENKEIKIKKPTVMFPITANPPNIGHIFAINTLLGIADKVIIIVKDVAQDFPPQEAVNVLRAIFSHYIEHDRIKVFKHPTHFELISEIPEEFMKNDAYHIATTSEHIYSNLFSKGYPYLIFIPKAKGWRDEYYTIAFIRSIALSNIENLDWVPIKKV